MVFVIIIRALSEEATQNCIVGGGATGSSRTEMHFKFYGNEQLISGRDDTYTSCLHICKGHLHGLTCRTHIDSSTSLNSGFFPCDYVM